MSNLTLTCKSTAAWVSKSLLAKVIKCETDKEEGARRPSSRYRAR